MTHQVSSADMQYFAGIVWLLTGSESVESQTALAWLIVNRLESTQNADRTLVAACNSVLCDEGAEDRGFSQCDTKFGNRDYCRVFSIICRVWNGDQADPTGGAVEFHDHRQNPAWSHQRKASALIGRYFYYP